MNASGRLCNLFVASLMMSLSWHSTLDRIHGYTEYDVNYNWSGNAADSVELPKPPKDIKLPQFNICDLIYYRRTQNLSSGPYSRLEVFFVFERALGYYMMQVYLPSFLVVIISWVSFWLSRDAAPARVALGVTTVLTMTTLMTTTNSQMPKVSYIKAIDYYLCTSFMMVFAALLEYAWVGYTNKKLRMMRDKKMRSPPKTSEVPLNLPASASPGKGKDFRVDSSGPAVIGGPGPSVQIYSHSLECDCDLGHHAGTKKLLKVSRPQRPRGITPSQIDKYSRIFFPLLYACFNCGYWIIYKHIIVQRGGKRNPDDFVSKWEGGCRGTREDMEDYFKSDGYATDDIMLRWKTNPDPGGCILDSVKVNHGSPLPSFDIDKIDVFQIVRDLSSGNYSNLVMTITFVRQMGFYWIAIYLPAILVVCISWVSFWISRDSAPARVTLGVTTVLTITTLITNTNRSMPPVSYVKAVDIYLCVCYFMVFAALLEFALVTYSTKYEKNKLKKEKKGPGPGGYDRPKLTPGPDILQRTSSPAEYAETTFAAMGGDIDMGIGLMPPCTCPHDDAPHFLKPVKKKKRRWNPMKKRKKKEGGKKFEPGKVDRYSRLIFPALFVIFNILYWFIYLDKAGRLWPPGFVELPPNCTKDRD